MNTDFLPIIPAVLPLAIAPLCLLIKHRLFCWALTVFAMLTSSAASFVTLRQLGTQSELSYPFGGWDAPVGIEYSIDHLNGVLLFLTGSWYLEPFTSINSFLGKFNRYGINSIKYSG